MSSLQESKFTEEIVLDVTRHTPKLLTFTISRPETYRFSAGQFSRLGFRDGNGYIWRAYSIMSAEYSDILEYFAVLIPDGPMSAYFMQMKAGDTILLDKNATGFLLPERFIDGRELVMLCTGSGIAPFLSILEQPEVWQKFERLVLVHSVSYAEELIFRNRLDELADHPLVGEYFTKFSFLPVLTREKNDGVLHKRLPELLTGGQLSEALELPFTPEHTRFMLCGNPDMVKDTFQALLNMGFSMHRNKNPGQILMENGF